MKKISMLAIALVLAGCASGSAVVKKGEAASAKNDDGDYASVKLTLKDDKVSEISFDETKGGKSKKELGTDYQMKAQSGIGKEWDEQVAFLENYIVKNGLDAVKLKADGTAENDDVRSGCTISIKNLMDTAAQAKQDAKEVE